MIARFLVGIVSILLLGLGIFVIIAATGGVMSIGAVLILVGLVGLFCAAARPEMFG